MQAVHKEGTQVGYGVKVQKVDGRLRITVPCSKRWRGGMLFTLYLGIVGVLNPLTLITITGPIFWENVQTGSLSLPSLFFHMGLFSFWLIMVALITCAVLWFLQGRYVLEIGEKNVRVGRSLFERDWLSTHDATDLRRIRFAPALNMNDGRHRSVGMSWQPSGGKVFQAGRYHLHLDYGSKQPDVLHMAIEETQVRTIKEIIRTYYPHMYHSYSDKKPTAVVLDPLQEISVLKKQLK